jgi:hypothetical protein
LDNISLLNAVQLIVTASPGGFLIESATSHLHVGPMYICTSQGQLWYCVYGDEPGSEAESEKPAAPEVGEQAFIETS